MASRSVRFEDSHVSDPENTREQKKYITSPSGTEPKFIQIAAVPISSSEHQDNERTLGDTPPPNTRLFALDEDGNVWEFNFRRLVQARRINNYANWSPLTDWRKRHEGHQLRKKSNPKNS